MKASAKSFRRASEKALARSDSTFAQRVAQAVRARKQPGFRIVASSDADENSFAEELRKAVKRKSPRKRHEEQVEREKASREKQRPPTKSD
jgi:hypothetical protein